MALFAGGSAIWVEFGDCSVISDAYPDKTCVSLIERLSRNLPSSRPPVILDDVVLRGTVFTERKQVIYDKGVPQTVRGGFGHLDAYPAKIEVEQIVVPGQR
jgi:hypothetical protein